ncbi:MAG: potassium transporter KefB [Planctomycetota bacterium]|nr:MAG: potassium transporter KefB [Planctomycetota bacterium]
MEIKLLTDIVIIFALAIAVLFVCHKLRVPAILGFLVTGALAGPHGFAWITAIHEVDKLAEVGVVLLMFTIGIEMSFEHLLRMRKQVFFCGSLQVLVTLMSGWLLSWLLGLEARDALFLGMLFSLSSTAIVLQLLQKRGEIDSPHGNTTLGILIFQDLAIVPMILLTPLLGSKTGGGQESFLLFAAQAIGILAGIFALAKWVIPHVLHAVARTKDREFFLLVIVSICMGIAWMTSTAGLSLALGAFLAGLILSESDYSHSALGHILPFRDVFTSFFFVSVGMLFDYQLLLDSPLLALGVASSVAIGKALIAAAAVRLLGFAPRTAVITGLSLAQVGEFSFILSSIGLEAGLLQGRYQLFLGASVLSMAATPFLMKIAPRLADLLTGKQKAPAGPASKLNEHLVIIGFGVNGRNLARAARSAEIPYVILEMSPDTVRSERALGEPIFHGDATQSSVLEHAAIQRAKTVVVAINDPAATRRITLSVHQHNPSAQLLVRTRYLAEMQALQQLGATEVIPEEFETSIEIFARVLSSYLVPQQEIEALVAQVRGDGYRMLRSSSWEEAGRIQLESHLRDLEIHALLVEAGSELEGKTLRNLRLREDFGISVIALQQDGHTQGNPSPDTTLNAGTVAFFLASREQFAQVGKRFRAQDKATDESE